MSGNPKLIRSVSVVAALTSTFSVNGLLRYVGATFNSTPETLPTFQPTGNNILSSSEINERSSTTVLDKVTGYSEVYADFL